MSLACCRYTIRPVRREGDRRARKIGGGLGGVEAQMQPRRPSPGQLEQPHMYDDMRMNQNTGVATICQGFMD